ncbi:hypothetical protein [Actinomadura rugatobispora]|uniref:Uncharacterized protein n=1 Tax=Actinomadura rugatobispora TaxID=1994 RepID=A0ABW1AGT4_9ACTN|nr:hypothetical protein GCM10010200_085170 [Actinomadura rugatobispora]
MNAHLSDSDRQALRLAHDLREEMRQALPQQAAAPSVSPFVDPTGRPSVLMRMDEETARALMAVLTEQRAQAQRFPEPRRADGTHVPPPAEPAAAVPPQRHMPPPTAADFSPAPAYTGAASAPLLPSAFPIR